jgi:streptogramin lyase
VAIALFVLSAGCAARAAAQITVFPIPTAGGYPDQILSGPDGNLWFTEYLSNKIGRINPAGVVTGEYPIGAFGSNPRRIAAGPDGNLWFVEGGFPPRIGRMSPTGGSEELSKLNFDAPAGITAGPDGNVWITDYYVSEIARIRPTGELEVAHYVLEEVWPSAITAGPDGNLWFTEAAAPRLGRITTAGHGTHFEIPSGDYAEDIAAGPDGNLWFTERHGKIGRITTAGAVTEFSIPSGAPAGSIAAGSDGNLWFTEQSGIGRITPAGAIVEFHLPSSLHPADIAAGPDGNLWFTDPSNDRIGRIIPSGLTTPSGSTGPCVPDSTTLCLNESRFQVRAEWQVASRGTSGSGRAVPLTGDTGAFWFFDAENIELVVKALNACSLNGHVWFFAGGLTDVGVRIDVTDTKTGVSQTYLNPAGVAFQPIQDTAAFSTCP